VEARWSQVSLPPRTPRRGSPPGGGGRGERPPGGHRPGGERHPEPGTVAGVAEAGEPPPCLPAEVSAIPPGRRPAPRRCSARPGGPGGRSSPRNSPQERSVAFHGTPSRTGYSKFPSAKARWASSLTRNSRSRMAFSDSGACRVTPAPLTFTWAPRSPWFGKKTPIRSASSREAGPRRSGGGPRSRCSRGPGRRRRRPRRGSGPCRSPGAGGRSSPPPPGPRPRPTASSVAAMIEARCETL
jgi:hypothetical protein